MLRPQRSRLLGRIPKVTRPGWTNSHLYEIRGREHGRGMPVPDADDVANRIAACGRRRRDAWLGQLRALHKVDLDRARLVDPYNAALCKKCEKTRNCLFL